jgi:regulator of sigma E protease
MDVLYFIVLVGVLVFVHELGHFAWAKLFDVKVLKFSLGFGPTIAGFRRGETEYVISAIPLGGYVKMLGEGPHDIVPEADQPRAFGNQSVWRRLIIVVAGPAMNLVFPVGLFFLVHLADDSAAPPVIGTVFPHRPADGRLLPGDEVLSIDGEPVETFYELSQIVGEHPGDTLELTLSRDGQEVQERVRPVLSTTVRELDRVERVGRLGIMPHHPLPVVGVVSPSSPAAAAGLETFDVIVSAAGRPVERWIDLERVFEDTGGTSVPVTFLRPERRSGALGGLADLSLYAPHVATLSPEPGRGSALLRAGLESAELYVSRVTAGSAEHAMGILPGDRIVMLDGRPVRMWATFIEDLKAGGGQEHELVWRRGDRLERGRFRLRHERGVDDHGQRYDRYVVGLANWLPMRVDAGVAIPDPVSHAFSEALRRTGEMVEVTVLSVVRLIEGRLTVKSIGGPITIFDVAGTAAREGTTNYLTLMAFISVNLGLINLLPVPLLDGGHLLFFLVEGVSRRRLSAKARQYASLVGLVLLVTLMLVAFKNDLERQWPDLFGDEVGAAGSFERGGSRE